MYWAVWPFFQSRPNGCGRLLLFLHPKFRGGRLRRFRQFCGNSQTVQYVYQVFLDSCVSCNTSEQLFQLFSGPGPWVTAGDSLLCAGCAVWPMCLSHYCAVCMILQITTWIYSINAAGPPALPNLRVSPRWNMYFLWNADFCIKFVLEFDDSEPPAPQAPFPWFPDLSWKVHFLISFLLESDDLAFTRIHTQTYPSIYIHIYIYIYIF